MKTCNLLIGGHDTMAADGRTFTRRNPVSGEVVTTAAAASAADASRAADAAKAAFPAWSALGPNERRARLNGAAALLESRTAQFAEVMSAETGATRGWGLFNVHKAATLLREAAAMTTQITGEVIPSDIEGNLALALRQPAGVVLGIAPWNAPVILGVRAVAMPLACGNTAILKASEVCPATHHLIGTTLQEAGFGDGIVNLITSDASDGGTVAQALISHPAVKRINFTGSTRVGRLVAEMCARHLKPVLLELGGKAPLIVLDDADIDAAVAATVFGGFANAGQICMSTERVIIDQKVADEFSAKLTQRVTALSVGDPSKGSHVLGSVVGMATVERTRKLLGEAVTQGAEVLCGGEDAGTIMRGAVVDRVTPEMALFHEETFAPQVSITRVGSAEEAVRLANNTEYGLSASIFSRNISRAFELARQLETGMCHINGPTVHDEPQMPFGGVKASGYGRFGGKAGIEAFTELRWVTIQTTPRIYPF